MKKIFKTYNFLVLVATILLAASLLLPAVNLAFNIYDSYYMIDNVPLIRWYAIFLFVFALFYKFLKSFIASNILSWTHILLSILFFFLACYSTYNFNKSLTLAEFTSADSTDYSQGFKNSTAAMLLGFLVVQLLPIINLIIGLMRRKHAVT
ncbi:hypothetical protein FFJ24_007665 [Pedobacter sp. KBS0701]|uniref:hypothetical protein n=1 Tax=Pedobacter sp. KBS0701 TaxID=2578106 RepID=UPI00110F5713|nr:hypothetical protein [Pedobacter sp. KBS0701]QDW24698.1 hypothetical protein FFJ24_007665 [Pedobacter sp. KBS0701]